MTKFINDSKLFNEQSKFKNHCEFCGHTLSFYFYEKDKKVCSFCGMFNYRDDFVKFKYKLKEKGLREKIRNA